MLSVASFLSAGRDPRAMDARGPVTAQRVPMVAGMPGPVPHSMGSNAPPPARPVKPSHVVCLPVGLALNHSLSCFLCWGKKK